MLNTPMPGHPGHLTSSNLPWPAGWAPQGLGGSILSSPQGRGPPRASQQAPSLPISGLKSSPSPTSHMEAEDSRPCLSFPVGPQAHLITSVALSFPICTGGGEGSFYLLSLLCAKHWFSTLHTLTSSILQRPGGVVTLILPISQIRKPSFGNYSRIT